MPVIIDLSFRLQGNTIPADHGYALYGAVSRIVKWVHARASDAPSVPAQAKLGIHTVNGLLAGNRLLHLTPSSRLTFRLDSDDIKNLLSLAGKELDLDGHKLRVGVPTVYALKPKAVLHSRLVTIKHRMEPQPFLEAIQAELSKLGIKAQPGLVRRTGARPLEGRSGSDPDRSPLCCVRAAAECGGRRDARG